VDLFCEDYLSCARSFLEYNGENMTKVTRKFIAGFIYLILASACFLLMWKMSSNYDIFLKDAQSSQGKVIAVEDVRDELNIIIGYHPVIEFQTDSGVKVISKEYFVADHLTFKGNRGRTKSYSVGDSVQVLYHAKNPQKIMLVNHGALDTQQAPEIGLLGIIFLGCGIYTIGVAIRSRKNS
jgi:hypothetical protein